MSERAARGTAAWLTMWVVLCLAGCAGPAADRAELLVASAISFEPALIRVQQQPETGGASFQIHSGASGLLAQQLRHGAPIDLFISASPVEIERLRSDELIDGAGSCVAENRLVLVVPADRSAPSDLQELAGDRFQRITIGNPRTAPVGRYAEQALRTAGLWAALRPRLLVAENARQAIDYVVRGEADAGICYASDARRFADRVRAADLFSTDSYDAIRYIAVVPIGAPNRSRAAQLAARLSDAAIQTDLDEIGFLRCSTR